MPEGLFKVTIEPINMTPIEIDEEELTLEEMRARLAASGLLVTDFSFMDDPELDDLKSISEEELDELTRDITAGRSTEDLVNEDRGDY
jgi:hypothetical protein